MSRRARDARLNAYTPSHMNDGTLHTRRQRMGRPLVCVVVQTRNARTVIVSQADAGTTTWLGPDPRERSMV
jgi:hypothetical protein